MFLLSMISRHPRGESLYPLVISETVEGLKDWALDHEGIVYGEWQEEDACGLVRTVPRPFYGMSGHDTLYSISTIDLA